MGGGGGRACVGASHKDFAPLSAEPKTAANKSLNFFWWGTALCGTRDPSSLTKY